VPAPADIVPTARPVPWRLWIRVHLLERTLRRLPRGPGVLDLGCGWGFYFRINPAAIGIDGDPAAVGALRAEGRDARLGDLRERLPFEDGAFGHVVAHDVLEHFAPADLERIAGEVHRVLRPGGRFVVLVPNRAGYDLGLREGAGHVTFVGAPEVEALARGRFALEASYPEPLPRWLGSRFVHNKEVFVLRREG